MNYCQLCNKRWVTWHKCDETRREAIEAREKAELEQRERDQRLASIIDDWRHEHPQASKDAVVYLLKEMADAWGRSQATSSQDASRALSTIVKLVSYL